MKQYHKLKPIFLNTNITQLNHRDFCNTKTTEVEKKQNIA